MSTQLQGGGAPVDGEMWTLQPMGNSGGAGDALKPFQVTDASTTGPDVAKVKIEGGVIYGDGLTAAGHTVTEATHTLANGTNYVYLKVPVTAAPSAATVKHYWEINTSGLNVFDDATEPSNSGDLPGDSTGYRILLLAVVEVSSNTVESDGIDIRWTGDVELVSGVDTVIWARRG